MIRKKPNDPGRDRFILSKGHGAPALFQVLAKRGFYPEAMLDSYGQDGGIFAEHPPTPDHLAGIEKRNWFAWAWSPHWTRSGIVRPNSKAKLQCNCSFGRWRMQRRICLGEIAMMVMTQQVDNLMIIVDFNKWQATGRTEEVLELSPLVDKWRAFGWDACEIDGHDMVQLTKVLSQEKSRESKPIAVIAHTVKGKRVSFMEDDNNWHYKIPSEEELASALKELGVEA